MTIRYVDVGAGASDDYDPSDRSVGGGGGFNNYITIAAARDAASA